MVFSSGFLLHRRGCFLRKQIALGRGRFLAVHVDRDVPNRYFDNMSDIDDTIGAKAVQLRKRAGLKQEDVARLAKISRPFLSLLEQGKRGWSADLLITVGDALGVGAAGLLPDPPQVPREDRAAG